MRSAVLADTGPLYAAVDPHDQHHVRAQTELTKLSQGKLEVVIAYPTLFESFSLILYRLGGPKALGWLAEIRDGATLLAPALEDYQLAGEKLRRYPDQSITLFDALVSVLSTRSKMPVWTYDHHFDVMRSRIWR